jgi:hypothetical protein
VFNFALFRLERRVMISTPATRYASNITNGKFNGLIITGHKEEHIHSLVILSISLKRE